jgi:hypothetical protein
VTDSAYGRGMARLAALAAAGVLAVGCNMPFGVDHARGEGDTEVVHRDDAFEVTLQLDRSAVARGESFEARLTVRNTGSQVEAWSCGAGGCLSFLSVTRGGEVVPFHGSQYACLGYVKGFQVAPGETLERTWTITAATPQGAAARGAYRLNAHLTVGPDSGPRPTLTIPIRVE